MPNVEPSCQGLPRRIKERRQHPPYNAIVRARDIMIATATTVWDILEMMSAPLSHLLPRVKPRARIYTAYTQWIASTYSRTSIHIQGTSMGHLT